MSDAISVRIKTVPEMLTGAQGEAGADATAGTSARSPPGPRRAVADSPLLG